LVLRLSRRAVLLLLLALGGFAGSRATAAHAAPSKASAAPLAPRETIARLDSLVHAGDTAGARALCTGQALRLLPFLIAAEARLAPFIDTARSRDTVLAEARRGAWAAVKMRAETVFLRPVMGLSSLVSLQAVHLYRDGDVWKVADLEELTDAKAPLVVRSGVPSGDSAGSMLPVSRLVPARHGVDRLRLEVALHGGDSLPPLPRGASQTVLRRGRDRATLETRRLPLPDSSPAAARRAPSPGAAYLASNKYLDLSDPALRARAEALKRGSPHAVETTRRIHAFVSGGFKYKLGASLFSDSRTALRDMRGDCSEAAVLTAALLRAAGIPSRVAMGYASLGKGVFIGHAWTEAYLGGAWIGVDAALREFPAGAERVAFLHLSGARDMQTDATNLMMRMLANLDIQITGATLAGSPVPLREQAGNEKEVRAFLDEVLKGIGQ
jgi:hypothetical protein